MLHCGKISIWEQQGYWTNINLVHYKQVVTYLETQFYTMKMKTVFSRDICKQSIELKRYLSRVVASLSATKLLGISASLAFSSIGQSTKFSEVGGQV